MKGGKKIYTRSVKKNEVHLHIEREKDDAKLAGICADR
jgi:hypothetical protein